MDVIRDLVGQYILLFMNLLILPVLVLLVMAAINEKIRRIVLWILAPVTVLLLLAYAFFSARDPSEPRNWKELLLALGDSLVAALPYLLVLIVFGIAAYMLGPYLAESTGGWMERRARSKYLQALIDRLSPASANLMDLEAQRKLVERLQSGKVVSLRIRGEAGSGKSTLLRMAALELARQAQAKDYLPVPVLIDLDTLLAFEADIDNHPGVFTHPRSLSALQEIRVPYLERMLRQAGRKRRLCFLIDGSAQHISPAFLSPAARANLLRDLSGMVEYFAPCPFLIALPDEASDPGLERDIHEQLALEGPDAGTVRSLLGGEPNLSGTPWSSLARRVLVLRHLVAYTKSHRGTLPANLRELFRETAYPKGVPVERVEAAMVRLANEVRRAQRYALPLGQVRALLQAPREKRSLLPALEESGLLRSIEVLVDNGTNEDFFVQFAHPLYLAYFTALGWFHGTATGTAIPDAGALAQDPLLADAMVFFLHTESDPGRFAAALEGLSGQENGLFLVTQCLLVLPPNARPPGLVRRAVQRLVEAFAYDESAVAQARSLLAGMDGANRLETLEPVLAEMDEPRLEQTLKRVNALDTEAGRPWETVRMILWHGGNELAHLTGRAWVESEPEEAFDLLRELFERGPEDRRGLALDLLGQLPRALVETYLDGLLSSSEDPHVRTAALRGLVTAGSLSALALLELVAARDMPDEVRVHAAQVLCSAGDPSTGVEAAAVFTRDLASDSMVREIVRVSRVPMPERARSAIQDLLETLRGRVPQGVARWEAVVNPYIVGRPVGDPAMFFGREGLMHELRVAVENGGHVLLHGERRIGKTSILRQVLRQLQEEAARGVPVRAAALDLQGLLANEFFETLIRAAIEQIREPGLFADSQVPRPYTDQSFERDLAGLMDHLRQAHGPNFRLALLLDEADTLESYPAAMQSALRRILTGESARGLAVILAGTQAAQHWARPESPLYNLFSMRAVPRLASEEAARLVVEPVAETFQYEPQALEAVLRATQGRPYEIQALCQRLVNHLLSCGERVVTADMVRELLQGGAARGDLPARGDLIAQADSLLTGLMDWLENNPEATNAQVEEQLKETWDELRRATVQQVIKMRSARRG